MRRSRQKSGHEVVVAWAGGGRKYGEEWMDQKAGQEVRSANLDTAAAAWPVYPAQRASLRARVYGSSLTTTAATARPHPSI